ncbi:MAG: glutamate racemase [Cyclobacteriaceae bacterium]
MNDGPIGIFDSGFGGLTVLREIHKALPQHDFLYLGDNARSPYGSRSFETIYEYTLECVRYLFEQNCPLIILACNTASAKALRNIQQNDLPHISAEKRVLGVIRPTAEVIGNYSKSKHVGVLGTTGTINSNSYLIEIEKQDPYLKVFQQSCPMWVPIVEYGEATSDGTDYFIKQYLDELFAQSPLIDTILLACTHYPLLIEKIRKYVPDHITILNQGEIVAPSLANYLNRHKNLASHCLTNQNLVFKTTDSTEHFDKHATDFFGRKVSSQFIHI